MTRDETIKLLAVLTSVWSKEVIDDAKITAWSWAFADDDAAAVEIGVKAWIRDGSSFFPVPSDVRRLMPAAGPKALMAQTDRNLPTMMIYRMFDAETDTYVELPEPVPWSEALAQQNRDAMRDAWQRRREHGHA